MNVNKLNKEVPSRPPFPTISMSGPERERERAERERASTRHGHMLFTLLIFQPVQDEQEAQSSFSSTYPFIGLSHEIKGGPGARAELGTRLRRDQAIANPPTMDILAWDSSTE